MGAVRRPWSGLPAGNRLTNSLGLRWRCPGPPPRASGSAIASRWFLDGRPCERSGKEPGARGADQEAD